MLEFAFSLHLFSINLHSPKCRPLSPEHVLHPSVGFMCGVKKGKLQPAIRERGRETARLRPSGCSGLRRVLWLRRALICRGSCRRRNWHLRLSCDGFLLPLLNICRKKKSGVEETIPLFSDPRGLTPKRLPSAFRITEQFSAIKRGCGCPQISAACRLYLAGYLGIIKIHHQTIKTVQDSQ